MLIDSHLHFDQYSPIQQQAIFQQLEQRKIAHLIAVSTDLASVQTLQKFSQKQPRFHFTAGFHPEQQPQDIAPLLAWIDQHHQELVAIGEVGLPQYLKREHPHLNEQPYREILAQFMQKSHQYDLPIVLHAVYDDALIALEMLQKYGVKKAHFHWFKAEGAAFEAVLHSPYFVSLCPDVLFNPKTQRVAREFPLERLMIETDGPWQHEGFSPERLDLQLQAVMEKIAEIKGLDKEKVKWQIAQNTRDFYNLSA